MGNQGIIIDGDNQNNGTQIGTQNNFSQTILPEENVGEPPKALKPLPLYDIDAHDEMHELSESTITYVADDSPAF